MSSIRRPRFIAALMLFVWCFTLGAAIANACLLHEVHAPGGGIDAAMARTDTHHAGGTTHQSMPVQEEQTGADDGCCAVLAPDAMACLGTQAVGQVPVPKPKSVEALDPHADPLPIPTSWVSSAVGEPPPAFDGSAFAPRPEPPVFIRFLRLTL